MNLVAADVSPLILIEVGMAWLAPPLPPNRTGGFPASGSPVSGVSSRLTIGAGAVFQTKQPPRRKPSAWPFQAVGLAQPIARSFLPFTQHRSQASPQPSVRPTKAGAMAIAEVSIPDSQDRIGSRD